MSQNQAAIPFINQYLGKLFPKQLVFLSGFPCFAITFEKLIQTNFSLKNQQQQAIYDQITQQMNWKIVWKFGITKTNQISLFITFMKDQDTPINFTRKGYRMSQYAQIANRDQFFTDRKITIDLIDKTPYHENLRITQKLQKNCYAFRQRKNLLQNFKSLQQIILQLFIISFELPISFHSSINTNRNKIIRQIMGKIKEQAFPNQITRQNNEQQLLTNASNETQVFPNQNTAQNNEQQLFTNHLKEKNIFNIQTDFPQQIKTSCDEIYQIDGQGKYTCKIQNKQQLYRQINEKIENRKVTYLHEKDKKSQWEIIAMEIQPFRISRTTNQDNNYDNKSKSKIVFIRIPQSQRRNKQILKKMRNIIQNIANTSKSYSSKRPQIYLIRKESQKDQIKQKTKTSQTSQQVIDYDAEGFFMEYAGQSMHEMVESSRYSYKQKLEMFVGLAISIKRFIDNEIIHGDMKLYNACVKTLFSNCYLIDPESVRPLKRKITLKYKKIVIHRNNIQGITCQQFYKQIKENITPSMKKEIEQYRKEQYENKQKEAELYISLICTMIRKTLQQTTLPARPQILQRLLKRIIQFQNKKIKKIIITQKQLNVMFGSLYDFHGYLQALETTMITHYDHKIQRLDEKTKLAFERLSLLIQIIRDQLKKEQHYFCIQKVYMWISMIKRDLP